MFMVCCSCHETNAKIILLCLCLVEQYIYNVLFPGAQPKSSDKYKV